MRFEKRRGKRSITPYPFKRGWGDPYTGDMQNMLIAFWNAENGQDMVEYSLLLGFIALSGAAVLTGLRSEMVNTWHTISTSFSAASTTAAS